MRATVQRLTLAGAVLLAGLAAHEGRPLVDYMDTLPLKPTPTACYGHTATARVGQVRTPDECTALLKQDLTTVYGPAVIRMVKVPLTQGQYDALTDFAYNLGINALRRSTLLAKVNAGDMHGASLEFDRWMYVGGKDCRIKINNCGGIPKRRAWEKATFLS